MIVLSASDLGKSYGSEVILENISFHINAGDRVGVVGVNGAGKTTLLNMLTGEITPEVGNFFVAKDTTLGYLKQRDNFRFGEKVIDEVSSIFSGLDQMEKEISELTEEIASRGEESGALWEKLTRLQNDFDRLGGYTYKSEIVGVMSSMGFGEDSYNMLTDSLSGGERTRLALACLLLKKPDILILDEPTNHLDIGTLKWLEQYLRTYKGTIILVSHDRYFLDSIATHIFDVENKGLTVYAGNYTEYAEKKRRALEADLKAYNKQQAEIRKQEDLIRSYKERGTEKLAKRAASREKRLAHVEVLDKPKTGKSSMKIDFHPKFQSGNDVIVGENLSFGYGTNILSTGVSFDIKRGEKVCIVGDNGIGKTTLLKVMMGNYAPREGYVKKGHNVELGYYDQGQLLLDDNETVIEEVHNQYRLYTDGEIRNILGRFLFRGDMVFNRVGDLSGGEKARLSLLKLMMSGANLLILDEPTNHLDIDSKEAFEAALIDYLGTVIAVSHDRYFLNRIPDRILELTENGLVEFLGNYDYYIEKKTGSETAKEHVRGFAQDKEALEEPLMDSPIASSKEERELKKTAAREAKKKERQVQELMDRIDELESLIAQGEAEMCLPETLEDMDKLRRIAREVDDWKVDLGHLYDKWMDISEE